MPPDPRNGGADPKAGHHTIIETANPHHEVEGFLQCKGTWRRGGGLAARHAAARRLPPIGRCGCIRDPARDRHRCRNQITDKQLDAAIDAAQHLLDGNLAPLFDVDTLRALWRRGGEDPALAEELVTLTGGLFT